LLTRREPHPKELMCTGDLATGLGDGRDGVLERTRVTADAPAAFTGSVWLAAKGLSHE